MNDAEAAFDPKPPVSSRVGSIESWVRVELMPAPTALKVTDVVPSNPVLGNVTTRNVML